MKRKINPAEIRHIKVEDFYQAIMSENKEEFPLYMGIKTKRGIGFSNMVKSNETVSTSDIHYIRVELPVFKVDQILKFENEYRINYGPAHISISPYKKTLSRRHMYRIIIPIEIIKDVYLGTMRRTSFSSDELYPEDIMMIMKSAHFFYDADILNANKERIAYIFNLFKIPDPELL